MERRTGQAQNFSKIIYKQELTLPTSMPFGITCYELASNGDIYHLVILILLAKLLKQSAMVLNQLQNEIIVQLAFGNELNCAGIKIQRKGQVFN